MDKFVKLDKNWTKTVVDEFGENFGPIFEVDLKYMSEAEKSASVSAQLAMLINFGKENGNFDGTGYLAKLPNPIFNLILLIHVKFLNAGILMLNVYLIIVVTVMQIFIIL